MSPKEMEAELDHQLREIDAHYTLVPAAGNRAWECRVTVLGQKAIGFDAGKLQAMSAALGKAKRLLEKEEG